MDDWCRACTYACTPTNGVQYKWDKGWGDGGILPKEVTEQVEIAVQHDGRAELGRQVPEVAEVAGLVVPNLVEVLNPFSVNLSCTKCQIKKNITTRSYERRDSDQFRWGFWDLGRQTKVRSDLRGQTRSSNWYLALFSAMAKSQRCRG